MQVRLDTAIENQLKRHGSIGHNANRAKVLERCSQKVPGDCPQQQRPQQHRVQRCPPGRGGWRCSGRGPWAAAVGAGRLEAPKLEAGVVPGHFQGSAGEASGRAAGDGYPLNRQSVAAAAHTGASRSVMGQRSSATVQLEQAVDTHFRFQPIPRLNNLKPEVSKA